MATMKTDLPDPRRGSYGVAAALALLACTLGLAADPAITPPGPADDLAGIERFLEPGTVLLLGELHGTEESPAFVSRVVSLALGKGRSVTVAFEFPHEETNRFETFLASAGDAADRTALLAGPFWQSSYQDGRRSLAMAQLLDDLRQHVNDGDPVRVVLFDRAGPRGPESEEAMTVALASGVTAAPGDIIITLVGNAHARLARGGIRGVSDPMAVRLEERLPEARIVARTSERHDCSSNGAAGCTLRMPYTYRKKTN